MGIVITIDYSFDFSATEKMEFVIIVSWSNLEYSATVADYSSVNIIITSTTTTTTTFTTTDLANSKIYCSH